MLYNNGHLYSAPVPQGPFKPVQDNFELLGIQGSAYFPRIWGEVYTGDPDLILLTHQQHSNTQVYLALIKRVQQLSDNVVRATWWANNDVLRGEPLVLQPSSSSLSADISVQKISCRRDSDRPGCPDLSSGLWVEGTLDLGEQGYSGVWFEVLNSTTGKQAFFRGWGFRWSSERQVFQIGYCHSPAELESQTDFEVAFTVDRAWSKLWRPMQQVVPFKVLVRNVQWNLTATEVYADDVLITAAGLGWAHTNWTSLAYVATGALGTAGGVTVTGVHHLTLPSTKKPRKQPVPCE